VTDGTNRVVGTRASDILRGFDEALDSRALPRMPELWDGHAAERIAAHIGDYLGVPAVRARPAPPPQLRPSRRSTFPQ
jgi:UDP-N-acetylglucosamine 2-epimerase (non-hydrolysing)